MVPTATQERQHPITTFTSDTGHKAMYNTVISLCLLTECPDHCYTEKLTIALCFEKDCFKSRNSFWSSLTPI